MSWEDFERLCLAVAERVDGMRDASLYGKRGQRQRGIDIYARDENGQYVVYQVRRIERVRGSSVRQAVDGYVQAGSVFNAARLVYCVASAASDTGVHDELADLRGENPDLGIELYDQERISRVLRGRPDIVRSYFGDDWALRFCGVPPKKEATSQHPPSDALLRGPIASLGLSDMLAEAETLPAAEAAIQLAQVASRLAAAGYSSHASRLRLRESDAFKEAGQVERAFDVAFDAAVEQVRAGDVWGSSGAHTRLEAVSAQVDDERQLRVAALEARIAWYEVEDAVDRLEELFHQLADARSGWTAEVATWFVETALADRRLDAIAGALRSLEEIRTQAPKPWETRLSVAISEARGEERLGGLLDKAMEGRLAPDQAALICMRGGRQLAFQGDSRSSVSAYRRAIEFATNADLPGTARAALYSIIAVGNLLHQIEISELVEASELARMVVDLPGSLPVRISARQAALGSLATAEAPEARMRLRRFLLESRIQGDLSGEIEAHQLLGKLLARLGMLEDAVLHLVRGGDAAEAERVAARLPATLVDLSSEYASRAPWERSAAHLVTGQQGALLSPEEVAQRAPVILDDLHRGHIEGYGWRLRQTAEKAAAGSAVVFPAKLVPKLLEVTASGLDAAQRQKRAADEELVEVVRVIHLIHPKHRREVVDQLAGYLSVGPVTLGSISKISTLRSRPLSVMLRALADQGNRHALQVLALADIAHPTMRHVALAEFARILDHPVGSVRTTFSIGEQFGMLPGLARQLDAGQRRKLAWQLVAIAGDQNELSVNRSTALIGLFNLRHRLPKKDRSLILDAILALDSDTTGNSAHQIQLASQHPLSRFRIQLGGPTEFTDSILVAAAGYADEPVRASVVARRIAYQLRLPEADPQRLAAAIGCLPGRHQLFDARELAASRYDDLRVSAVVLWSDAPNDDPGLAKVFLADPAPAVRTRLAWSSSLIAKHDLNLGELITQALQCDANAWVRRAAQQGLPRAPR